MSLASRDTCKRKFADRFPSFRDSIEFQYLNPSIVIFQSVFSIARDSRDRTRESESRRVWGTRQVSPLTRLHLERERHANESICVCPQGTDGIPGAEVQLAFDYRSSSGATATQSDTVWPGPGVTTTHSAWSTPGTVSGKEKKKIEKRILPFTPSVRFQRERSSSVLRLSPSFVRSLSSRKLFIFFVISFRIANLLMYLDMRAFSSIPTWIFNTRMFLLRVNIPISFFFFIYLSVNIFGNSIVCKERAVIYFLRYCCARK